MVIRNFGGQSGTFIRKRVTENLIAPKQGGMLHRLRRDGRPWLWDLTWWAHYVTEDHGLHAIVLLESTSRTMDCIPLLLQISFLIS